jgi:hypothetical protein
MSQSNNEREKRRQEFVRLLSNIEFGRRYYEFWDRCVPSGNGSELTQQDLATALAETGFAFTYHKQDRFFAYEDPAGGLDIGLHVAFRHAQAEFIIGFDTPYGGVGGPFHSLAAKSEGVRRRGWEHDPLYPRLPFATRENLRAVLAFGVGLYEEVRILILAHDWS